MCMGVEGDMYDERIMGKLLEVMDRWDKRARGGCDGNDFAFSQRIKGRKERIDVLPQCIYLRPLIGMFFPFATHPTHLRRCVIDESRNV